MENASKALIIAAEILIALIIITAIVMGYNSLKDLQQQEKSQVETEQLIVFNKEYESYNRKLLRGVDVISAMNRAIDNNAKYTTEQGYDEEYYKIDVEFIMKEEVVFKKGGGQSSSIRFKINTPYTMDEFETIRNNTDAFTDFKRRVFDCTKMEYSKKSGRVSKIQFTERKIDYTEGF